MASTSPSLIPCKRKSQYKPFSNEDASSDTHSSSLSDTGLPALLMLIMHSVYIRAGGHFCRYQFTNTCVLDSVLAAFHICYIKLKNVRLLLESNLTLRVVMSYLNTAEYGNAKALWLRQLGEFHKRNEKEINMLGTVKDHFPMFAELVCAEVDYRQETPGDNPVYETTVSKFRELGDVKVLGAAEDPTMILVIPFTKVPKSVEDGNKRIFELQFLLLGEGAHMVMCFNFSKDIWILYDNNPALRSFRPFNFERDLNRYMICWAGYVNTTEADEQKTGIPETGVGAQPFYSSSFGQQENLEESMEGIVMRLGDLSCGTLDTK